MTDESNETLGVEGLGKLLANGVEGLGGFLADGVEGIAQSLVFQLPAGEFVKLILDPRFDELRRQAIDKADRDVKIICQALGLPAEADSAFDSIDIRQLTADAEAIRAMRERYLSPATPQKRGQKPNEAYNRAYGRVYHAEPALSQSEAFELMLLEEGYDGDESDKACRSNAFKAALFRRRKKEREIRT